MNVQLADSISEIVADDWNALAGDMPLLSHAFLSALEASKSVGARTGWQPCPLLFYEENTLVGAIPLYIKNHSYGEYVFDWAWAEAYKRNGLNYYPKLVSAIPFSPITSQRLLLSPKHDQSQISSLMVKTLEQFLYTHQFSSVHVLFPNETSVALRGTSTPLIRSQMVMVFAVPDVVLS